MPTIEADNRIHGAQKIVQRSGITALASSHEAEITQEIKVRGFASTHISMMR
jgi:hypothetical protein